MIHFQDWLQIREMSASGRRRRQAALGLAPPVADIFSRSTPAPWEVENLTKALKKSKKKKKKSKCNDAAPFPGDSVVETKKSQPIVHKDIDSFIRSVELLAKDVWELDLLKKKKAAQDKMDQTTKRNTGAKKPEVEKSVEEPEDEEKPEDQPTEKDRNERKPKIGIRKPKAVEPPPKSKPRVIEKPRRVVVKKPKEE